MRQKWPLDGTLEGSENPGAIGINVRPVKEWDLKGEGRCEELQGSLGREGGIASYVDGQSNAVPIGFKDVSVEAREILDCQDMSGWSYEMNPLDLARGQASDQRRVLSLASTLAFYGMYFR